MDMLTSDDFKELSLISQSLQDEKEKCKGILVGGCPKDATYEQMEKLGSMEYPYGVNHIPSPEYNCNPMFTVRCGDWVILQGFGDTLMTVCNFEGTRSQRLIWVRSCIHDRPPFRIAARCVIDVHRAHALDSHDLRGKMFFEASTIQDKERTNFHVIRITHDGIVLRNGLHPLENCRQTKTIDACKDYGEEGIDHVEYFKEFFVAYKEFDSLSYKLIEPVIPTEKSQKQKNNDDMDFVFEMDGGFKKPTHPASSYSNLCNVDGSSESSSITNVKSVQKPKYSPNLSSRTKTPSNNKCNLVRGKSPRGRLSVNF